MTDTAGTLPHTRGNTAQTGAEALACFQLRLQGLTLAAIATELGLSTATVHRRIEAFLTDNVDPAADQLRRLELARLDDLQAKAYRVMETTHYVVDKGSVVLWQDEPLVDDGPVLQAIDRLVRISERRAKLLGLDAPVKQQVEVNGLRYEIVGIDLERLT
ncbi:helix-turn-helix domain-containing protein [Nonomuraea angiospora]|uniref:helix-turn-helix domain-containing protein n=1 Tax=Nonomuraea angiospora TaxID=46172 RepID=UPI0033F80302